MVWGALQTRNGHLQSWGGWDQLGEREERENPLAAQTCSGTVGHHQKKAIGGIASPGCDDDWGSKCVNGLCAGVRYYATSLPTPGQRVSSLASCVAFVLVWSVLVTSWSNIYPTTHARARVQKHTLARAIVIWFQAAFLPILPKGVKGRSITTRGFAFTPNGGMCRYC